jgi:hypothetical protein
LHSLFVACIGYPQSEPHTNKWNSGWPERNNDGIALYLTAFMEGAWHSFTGSNPVLQPHHAQE